MNMPPPPPPPHNKIKIDLKADQIDTADQGVIRSAIWDSDTYEKNFKVASLIRKYTKKGMYDVANNLLNGFDSKIERCWNDHKNVKYDTDDPFEPRDVAISKNTTTNAGIETYVLILANRSIAFPSYFAAGTSTLGPSIGQQMLLEETARVPMDVSGWLTPARNILRQGGIFSPGMRTAMIAEFGSYNSASSGTLFFRVVLSENNVLQHIQNATYLTASHSLEFRAG